VAGVLTAQNGLSGARATTIDVPLAGTVVAGPKPLEAPAPKLDVAHRDVDAVARGGAGLRVRADCCST